jgi:hypothetical protein
MSIPANRMEKGSRGPGRNPEPTSPGAYFIEWRESYEPASKDITILCTVRRPYVKVSIWIISKQPTIPEFSALSLRFAGDCG